MSGWTSRTDSAVVVYEPELVAHVHCGKATVELSIEDGCSIEVLRGVLLFQQPSAGRLWMLKPGERLNLHADAYNATGDREEAAFRVLRGSPAA
jgi:hypothetical protein